LIYFLQSIDGGPVKIGSSKDITRRHEELEAYYGRPLVLLATMEGGRKEETVIHQRFRRLRFGRTEQFRPDPELMEFIGRPLLVNQGNIELMGGVQGITIINLKGSEEQAAWLEAVHRKAHLPKSVIVRLALELWATKSGHPSFPAMEYDK
jgi:hypothetical protein